MSNRRLIIALMLLPSCAVAKPAISVAPVKRKLAAKPLTHPNITRPAQTLDAVAGVVRIDKAGAVHIEVLTLDKDKNRVGPAQYFTVLTDMRVISGDELFDSSTAQASNVVLDKTPDGWGSGTISEQVDAVVKALVDAGKVK